MSETKARTANDIQLEYQNLAFKAGNLQYQISENTKDLALLNGQMRDLNLEYVAVKNKEAEAEKAAAAEPKKEASDAS